VTAVLAARFANGFLVRDLRLMRGDPEPVFAGELFRRDFQMNLTLSGERHFLQFRVLTEMQRWILLLQFMDRGGQLHLILAIRGFDRERIDGLQCLDFDPAESRFRRGHASSAPGSRGTVSE